MPHRIVRGNAHERNIGPTTWTVFHLSRSYRVARHSDAVAYNTSACTSVG